MKNMCQISKYPIRPLWIMLLSLLCIFIFSSVGFQKESDCRYVGNLIGIDATRCGCCGGWEIEIEGNYFLADSIPNQRQVLSPKDSIFPIPVYLDYRMAEFCSNRKRIVITCIKKR
jgi:hypothetical protein